MLHSLKLLFSLLSVRTLEVWSGLVISMYLGGQSGAIGQTCRQVKHFGDDAKVFLEHESLPTPAEEMKELIVDHFVGLSAYELMSFLPSGTMQAFSDEKSFGAFRKGEVI